MIQIVEILKPYSINVGIDFDQEINFTEPDIDPKSKKRLKQQDWFTIFTKIRKKFLLFSHLLRKFMVLFILDNRFK